MEIKSCEEYVLNELEKAQNKVAEEADKINELVMDKNAIEEELGALKFILGKYLKLCDGCDAIEMNFVWNGYGCESDYEFLLNYLKDKGEEVDND